ncbi:MAG: LytR family transcriptional regulator [Lachnospiraceae bacterium]|nr:LytR family transcriptional regulator [Lachnospiraceae bacterium]
MARKKSLGRIMAVQLIRSFLIVIAMLITGIVSYKATLMYYEVVDDSKESDNILDIVGDVTADSVSRNIIYSVEDSGNITGIVIEILNMGTNNLDYITVPVNTQINIDAQLYKRLTSSGIDVPQIINLKDINTYFAERASYEYGILLLEETLGIDIGYYTCMSKSVFDECFVRDVDVEMYRLTDAVVSGGMEAVSEGSIAGYIKSWCDKFKSNIDSETKLKYADSYCNVNPEFIYYYVLKGEYQADICTLNTAECKSLYQTVLSAEPHTSAQVDVPDISSVGLNIIVLNGSGGTNIAANTKSVLVENGFNVVKIADSPDGIIENTVIYVKKEGMGRDLIQFFSNPSIEVVQMQEGADITVVVGTSDVGIGK